MGIIRSFLDLNEGNFIRLYKALVKPYLEFGSIIWSLSRKEDITSIERLKKLNLPTLVYRRLRGEMIEIYKITSGKYNSRVAPVLNFNIREELITRGHQYKLHKERCNTRIRQSNYMNRIVNSWNCLPSYVVEAPSITTFEKRLDKYWEHQEVRVNYMKWHYTIL